MAKPRFRRPRPEAQQVLDQSRVLLITPQERRLYEELIVKHHYFHSHQPVGVQLCYVATFHGQWLGLSSWCAAARYLKARDRFIGWTPEQCRQRRALIANNARLLLLPGINYPNLASRFMRLILGRLSEDWQARFDHPLALAESFFDPEQFRGTTRLATTIVQEICPLLMDMLRAISGLM